MYQKLKDYIAKVCREACESEGRPVYVDFQYAVIDDTLLFAMRSPYERVRKRIQYRLERNLPKNFGLNPCNVEEPRARFDWLYGDIDYNFSFAEWEVFGVWGTLRTVENPKLNPHMRLSDMEIGEPNRYLKVCAAGFEPQWDPGNLTSADWKNFCDYYEKAFGERPYVVDETVTLQVREEV